MVYYKSLKKWKNVGNKRLRRQELTIAQVESRRASDRARYTNMTPEQKQAKIVRTITLRALRRNTPSKNSIAMENPLYNLSDVSFSLNASALDGCMISSDCPTLGVEGSPIEVEIRDVNDS